MASALCTKLGVPEQERGQVRGSTVQRGPHRGHLLVDGQVPEQLQRVQQPQPSGDSERTHIALGKLAMRHPAARTSQRSAIARSSVPARTVNMSTKEVSLTLNSLRRSSSSTRSHAASNTRLMTSRATSARFFTLEK